MLSLARWSRNKVAEVIGGSDVEIDRGLTAQKACVLKGAPFCPWR